MNKLSQIWPRLCGWLDSINADPRRKRTTLLVLGLLSLYTLRFLPLTYNMHLLPAGFDFANLYWFHHCGPEITNHPYLVEGKLCGDQLNRPMIYPPTLYWTYIWTRAFNLKISYAIWCIVIIAGLWTVLRSLVEKPARHFPLLVFVTLLVQLPSAFALERGNNDILVILAWAALVAAWTRRRYGVAGACAALAVMFKLYPALPLVAFGGASLWRWRRERRWRQLFTEPEFQFCVGFALGAVALWLTAVEQNWIYFTQVLPPWANKHDGIDISIHSVQTVVGSSHWIPGVLGLALLSSWGYLTYWRLKTDPVLVWWGLLALGTYFPAVSNDYNLITVYPLIALCWLRSEQGPARDLYFRYFVAAFFAPIGWRWVWKNWLFHPPTAHVVAQVLWLVSFALLAHRNNPNYPSPKEKFDLTPPRPAHTNT